MVNMGGLWSPSKTEGFKVVMCESYGLAVGWWTWRSRWANVARTLVKQRVLRWPCANVARTLGKQRVLASGFPNTG